MQLQIGRRSNEHMEDIEYPAFGRDPHRSTAAWQAFKHHWLIQLIRLKDHHQGCFSAKNAQKMKTEKQKLKKNAPKMPRDSSHQRSFGSPKPLSSLPAISAATTATMEGGKTIAVQ